jgi:hypothetical protein
MTSAVKRPATSYCVECDAAPGECSHGGPRYLEEVVYDRAKGVLQELPEVVKRPGDRKEPRRGWRAPDVERERWERPVMALAVRTKPSDRQPKSLQELVVALENSIDLDHPLERLLRAAYDIEPLKVTIIVEKTLDGQLRSPGGFLYKRLSAIEMPRGE